MDKSTQLVLITNTYTKDSIGQRVPSETRTTVFCRLNSVTQTEWNAAGQNGIRAEYRATIWAAEYGNQTICELDGVRYGIYRTYRLKGDDIELYLERKTGV